MPCGDYLLKYESTAHGLTVYSELIVRAYVLLRFIFFSKSGGNAIHKHSQ